jgi:hypothetical protein
MSSIANISIAQFNIKLLELLGISVYLWIFFILRCIHWNNVCNKINDCGDGSDEGANCDSYTGKRDEISTFSEDGGVGGNGVDASTGTVVS